MKEILLEIKRKYLEYVSKYKTEDGYKYTGSHILGLCSIASQCEYADYLQFKQYLNKSTLRQKVFFTFEGEKIYDNSKFLWKVQNIQARLDWLDKQISKF